MNTIALAWWVLYAAVVVLFICTEIAMRGSSQPQYEFRAKMVVTRIR